VTVVLFVLLRPLYYSAMSYVHLLPLNVTKIYSRLTKQTFSDYATKVFGFATFGRVYGAIICLAGLVNFSQYWLDSLTHSHFGGNPLPINVGLTIAGSVVGVILVGFVSSAGRRLRAENENQHERQPLLLEVDEEQ